MELLKNENSVEIILKKLKELSGLSENKPIKNFINPLKEAKKHKRLPNTGFLAGGAVCNTILSLLDGKSYPINDIDVFYIEDDRNNNQTNGCADRTNKINIFIGGYGEIMTIDSKSTSYSISSTDRDDIFNNVYVKKPREKNVDDNYSFILDGFDINCCMVGIDLEEKKLVYTKEFEDFLNHRQLLVSNPFTPAHTAIRLIKKKEELNVYLDIDKEFKYLSQVFLLFDNPYQKGLNKVFGNFFTQKYKDLFDLYGNKISEYFEIMSFADAKIQSFKKINGDGAEIPEYLLEMWEKSKNLYTLKPKKFSKQEDYLKYIPSSSKGPTTLKKLWEIYERSGKSEINKVSMILESTITRNFFFAIDNFHKCDFSEKQIEEFEKLFGGNEILISAIVSGKLNLQESLGFIRTIKSLTNKESKLFVDIIVERIVNDYGDIDKSKFKDKEFIKTIFEEEKTKRSAFITTPIEISGFEFKDNVYELVTEYDLLFGSRLLHNCMSNPSQNYSSKISKGDCKLFVIETENNYSGVEMEYSITGFKLKTVLGVANKSACEKHVYIANYLVSFLNHRHWVLRSNDIIDKLYNNMKFMSEKVKMSDDTKTLDYTINHLNNNRFGGGDFGINFNFDNGINVLQQRNEILNIPDIIRNNDNELFNLPF